MSMKSLAKKPTNLSIDKAVLSEARSLEINLSQAAEAGLRDAIQRAKSEAWKQENAKALASSNRWVDAHGLPLAKYRSF